MRGTKRGNKRAERVREESNGENNRKMSERSYNSVTSFGLPESQSIVTECLLLGVTCPFAYKKAIKIGEWGVGIPMGKVEDAWVYV